MKQHIKRVVLSGTKWSRRISILSLFAFIACTDYVQDIENQRDEWLAEETKQNNQQWDTPTWVFSSSSKNSSQIEDIFSSGDQIIESSSSNNVSSSDENMNDSSSSISHKEDSSSSSIVSSSSEYIEGSSSSSSENSESSSSSNITEPNSSETSVSSSSKESWAYLNPAISYGEMIDDRDGQVYKTIVIGEQTWMAENLNFAELGMTNCKDSELCEHYGRLYDWYEAVDISINDTQCGYGKQCALSYPIKGVCPNGWHLPTSNEWDALISKVVEDGGTANDLHSKTGWNENYGNGSDKYGFTLRPVGLCNENAYCGGVGDGGRYWNWNLQSQQLNNCAGAIEFAPINYSSSNYWDKRNRLSVRCVKN